jgi:predicted transcriptional regulator
MKKAKLLIGIRSLKEFKKEAIAAFKRAESRLPAKEPINRLYFADSQSLFSALSPRRMELLKFLRKEGPVSIRKAAITLKRDYKNVYDDVQNLSRVGLVKMKKDNKFYVPWDDINIEFSLAA